LSATGLRHISMPASRRPSLQQMGLFRVLNMPIGAA
jgi:hypothetical protein